MSFIIDQNDTFFFNLRQKQKDRRTYCHQQPGINEKRQKNCFGDIFKNIEKDPNQLITISQQRHRITLRVFLRKVYQTVAGVLKVEVNVRTNQVSFQVKLLNQQHQYLRIVGKERIRLLSKYINSRFFQYLITEFTIAVNPSNGEVAIKIPSFYFLTQFETQRLLEKLVKHVRFNFVESLGGFHNTMEMISEMNEDLVGRQQLSQRGQMVRENFNRYYKYSQVVNRFLYICSEQTHQQQFVVSNIKKENDSIDSLKNKYIAFQKEFLSLQMYKQISLSELSGKLLPELLIDSTERERIKNRIEMPSMQKSSNPDQNCYILNYIKTKKKMKSCTMKKICSGGFTSIYIAEIEYWYVGSYNLGAPVADESKTREPHKKYLIVKRENRQMMQEGKRSRIEHEKFILNKIKNGISIFLNKYYLLAEKDEEFEKDLFSDYISYPNLHEYCLLNRESLSFQTKIYLTIMIAQSLRYLSEYRIAHLDLKPTNIMTNKKLTIKLIDFGESFHPELKYHQPGFSMPYSAPENYRSGNSYNYKNDVFSLGIIMHEMFIGRYPFFFHDQELKDTVYRKKDYCNYWFHCSQGNAQFGESLVFPLLESIIVRCLHPRPESRPELQWIVYILRGCLDYFY